MRNVPPFQQGSRERASDHNCEAYALLEEARQLIDRAQAWIRASNEELRPPGKRKAA